MADDRRPSDGELVVATLAGQVEQFGELVRRYEGPLRRVACGRLGRLDWAEEVVQEAFLAAFRGLESYDSRFSFRTWLWTILLNQCRRRQGYEGREPRIWNWSEQTTAAGPAPGESLCPRPGPPAVLLAQERAEELERWLRTLPEPQADALRLRFFGGLKFQEIADALGCTLLTAKNRVRAGLLRLAELLEGHNCNSLAEPSPGESPIVHPSTPATAGGSDR